jgi:hypothetical protein
LKEAVMSNATHPLLALKTLGTLTTWKEWRELWDYAWRTNDLLDLELCTEKPKAEDLFGLAEFWSMMLHAGFNIRCDTLERVDRLNLYLSLADGWDNVWPQRMSPIIIEGGIGAVKEGGIPRYLSGRAFAELCTHVFKIEKGRGFNVHQGCSSMRFIAGNAEALDAILWFFRLDERLKIANTGLKSSEWDHRADVAITFAKTLFQHCWWVEQAARSEGTPESQVQMLRERHPRFVDMLYGIGAIQMLPIREMEHYRCELCEKRLEEIALGSQFWSPLENTMRTPTSLREALFSGSYEAQIVLSMRVMREEANRLKELQTLRREERELARKREVLEHS